MAENSEMARTVAQLPHLAQAIGALAWLIARSFSNNAWQSAHRYSYNGMVFALNPMEFGPETGLLYNTLRSWSNDTFRL